jgi:hypothetical protein
MTARKKPTHPSQMLPGKYAYGYTCPGFAYYGEFRPFAQQSIYGLEDYSSQIVGFNIIDMVLPHCKLFGPMESVRANNSWGGRIIFYRQHGNQLLMRYQPWHSAPKEHLFPWSLKLMEASFLWNLLDDATKRGRLDIDASTLTPPGTGYNFFTKLYMKNDSRWESYF